MMVAGATPKPGPQYWVNIAAAMVRVTMLKQLASLVHVISKVQIIHVTCETRTST